MSLLLLGLEVVDRLRDKLRRRTWDPDLALGRRGEDLAHRYLMRQGFTVVARNYARRSGPGELDIVAWDGETLVFVEVKTRRSEEFRAAETAVDQEKRKLIRLTALEHARRARVAEEKIRFDLVTVVGTEHPLIRHFRDAFGSRDLS